MSAVSNSQLVLFANRSHNIPEIISQYLTPINEFGGETAPQQLERVLECQREAERMLEIFNRNCPVCDKPMRENVVSIHDDRPNMRHVGHLDCLAPRLFGGKDCSLCPSMFSATDQCAFDGCSQTVGDVALYAVPFSTRGLVGEGRILKYDRDLAGYKFQAALEKVENSSKCCFATLTACILGPTFGIVCCVCCP